MRRELKRVAIAARSVLERTWIPLMAYYAMTIAVPIANGSGSTERAFLEHMAFVTVIPLTLVSVFSSIAHVWRRRRATHAPVVEKSGQRSTATLLSANR